MPVQTTGGLLAWPAALVILLLIVITELLPFLAGAGNSTGIFNLGNIYIGLHFSILPLICLMHLFWNTFGEITTAQKANRPASRSTLASALIPACYILILSVSQQPFFKPLLG